MPTVDFVTIVVSLQDHVKVGGPLFLLVQAFAYIAGSIFAFISLMQLKEVADNQRHSYRAPMMSFLTGAMMIASPELLSTFLLSAYGGSWSQNSPLGYIKDAGGSNQTFAAVMQLISFVGYVFFIRGIWILKEAGEPQRYAQSTVGKATVVLFAGMAAIYIDFTLKILGSTFGFDLSTYLNT